MARTPTPDHPRTVLITGSSPGGLGESLALAFHALPNTKVYATARTVGKLTSLAEKGIVTLPLDVTKPDSIAAAVAQVSKDTNGRGLDILVNNSGGGYTMPILDVDLQVARDTFEVNFFGVLAVTQAFTPLLIQAKGTIANIGSIAGEISPPWQVIYNASKAALHSLSDGMRLELSPFGITVIVIVAGGVATRFLDNRPPIVLPAGSLYKPVEASVTKDPTEGVGLTPHDPDVFARRIVANVVARKPQTWWWGGAFSSLIWVVVTFFRHGFMDGRMIEQAGLGELKKIRGEMETGKAK